MLARIIAVVVAPYLPSYTITVIYMLQSSEYQLIPYIKWYWRTQDFSRVAYRKRLEMTGPSRALLYGLRLGIILQILIGLVLLYNWYWRGLAGGWAFGLAILISYPIVWAHLIAIPLSIGRLIIITPKRSLEQQRAEQVFQNHPGIKIAVLGSYGKTSMKELLATAFGVSKKIAATPANKNVASSHAQFAQTLTGNEDIILIEYGEGAPGDIARFAKNTHPTHAVIAGLAAAHLDQYKTVEAAGKDIFSITEYVSSNHIYVNGESPSVQPFMNADFVTYDHTGTLGWKVGEVKVSIEGLECTLEKGKKTLKLRCGLLGRHQIGPISLAAALAHEFGIADDNIVANIATVRPFEHRMQPYQLHGAWIIDDTYNGNIDGIRAGTALLKELPAKRKIYVTPGLVDQDKETESIHRTMGTLIAEAKPDKVILMQNSVTKFIAEGLDAGGFAGELIIEIDPLNFYTNLGHFVAAGDLVVMQNDWPDNYQ